VVELPPFYYDSNHRMPDSWWKMRAYPVGDNCAGVMFENITEQVMVQKALESLNQELETRVEARTSELREANDSLTIFQKAVEEMPVGLAIARLEEPGNRGAFRFIYRNRAAAVASRLDEADHIGRRLDEAFPGLMDTELPGIYLDALHDQRAYSLPELRYGDSKVPDSVFSVEAIPLTATHIGIFFENITSLEDTNSQLLRAGRLASLGELTSGLAHDINNPLTGVILSCDRLVSAAEENAGIEDLTASVAKYAKRIGAQAQQAREIASRALRFAIGSTGTSRVIEVSDLVVNAQLVVSPILEAAGCTLSVDIQDGTVSGNRGRLVQVLANLLVNAADACGRGGKVDVIGVTNDDGLELTVSDDGPGIPDKYLDRIFEPFFSTKGPERGAGLGLSQSKRIIEEHGGTISMSTGQDEGTTFLLKFPHQRDTASAAKVTVREVGESAGQTGVLSALLVDDDEDVLTILAETMQWLGFEVRLTTGAEQAIREIEAAVPDLMFTDYLMPGMTGTNLCLEVLEDHPSLVTILISGNTTIIDPLEIERAGIDLVLQKPFTTAELESVLAEARSLMSHRKS